jgi:hypothetical protein
MPGLAERVAVVERGEVRIGNGKDDGYDDTKQKKDVPVGTYFYL